MREKKMLVMNIVFCVVVFGLILWPQASYRQDALESGLSYLEYYTMHPTFPKSITMVELFPKKGIAPSVFLLLHQ
jgi:hypothetical protein